MNNSSLFLQACDALLAQRVEKKLHSKGTEHAVLNRLFVAYPEPRDDKVRAPYIPPSVLQRKASKMDVDMSKFRDERTRRLERDIELEMGNKYFLDLKKRYLLKNEEEKYDVVPEIWEGHNVADFVDPNIVAVSTIQSSIMYVTIFHFNLRTIQKLRALKEEEQLREQAGYYDSDIAEDDEETKELLQQAEKIKEKEDLMRLDSRLRKSVEKAKMPRRIGRKRERSMSRLESELGSLGVDITKKKMRNLEQEQDREQLGKKIRVGRSPSLAASRPPPRQEIGVVDKKVLSSRNAWFHWFV